MQVIIWFPANATFDTVQSCAVEAVSLDDAVGQQGLFGFSSNVENWEMGLPIMKTSNNKNPYNKTRVGWKGHGAVAGHFQRWEGDLPCSFLGICKELATLRLQQPFWETSLRAGRNCCLSKTVLLCGGVIIIPHLAFLMKACAGVQRCP